MPGSVVLTDKIWVEHDESDAATSPMAMMRVEYFIVGLRCVVSFAKYG